MCIIDQPLTLPEVASDKTRNKTKRNGTKRNKMEKIFESVNSNVVWLETIIQLDCRQTVTLENTYVVHFSCMDSLK